MIFLKKNALPLCLIVFSAAAIITVIILSLPDKTLENAAGKSRELSGNVYYYTSSGSKYHSDRDCRYIRDSENVSVSYSEDELSALGLEPCSGCCK